MWSRIKRLFKAFGNFFVSVAEDPEMILEQNIRDLNAQVPKMNENIALVRANVAVLERERDELRDERDELDSKIQASIRAGRDDLAASFAVQLEALERGEERNQTQLETAQVVYERALQIKQAFMREKERRTRLALDAIRASRRAQLQNQVIGAFEALDVGSSDGGHGEMIRRIQERTALSDARVEVALESSGADLMDIERDAEMIRAKARVEAYKAKLEAEEAPALEAARARPGADALEAEVRRLDETAKVKQK